MQLHGAWPEALEEARRAGERCALAMNESAAAEALYRQGELHRLQGELGIAENDYRNAQPGRIRAATGPGAAAAGPGESARPPPQRSAASRARPPSRRSVLGCCPPTSRSCWPSAMSRRRAAPARSCEEIAERWQGGMLDAMAAHARGAVDLVEGDAGAALVALRHAEQAWREFEAPYEAARTRVLVGLACAALGDDDTAALELDAAREVLRTSSARRPISLASIRSPRRGASVNAHGLTPRELQVLRPGRCRQEQQGDRAALVISEHTVARHVQNIFAKLGVSSRTAASAFAFAHDLLLTSRGQK